MYMKNIGSTPRGTSHLNILFAEFIWREKYYIVTSYLLNDVLFHSTSTVLIVGRLRDIVMEAITKSGDMSKHFVWFGMQLTINTQIFMQIFKCIPKL